MTASKDALRLIAEAAIGHRITLPGENKYRPLECTNTPKRLRARTVLGAPPPLVDPIAVLGHAPRGRRRR